jgi:uncharacterized protein (DUF433 family)
MAAPTVEADYEEELVQDLLFLMDHVDQLEKVVTVDPQLLTGFDMPAITKNGAERISVSEHDFNRLANILTSIKRTQTRMRMDASRVLEVFAGHLEGYAREKRQPEVLDKWQSVRAKVLEAIRTIGTEHPLSLIKKAWGSADQDWVAERVRYASLTLRDCIEVDPDLRSGVPVLRGTRFTVAQMLAELADGRSLSEIAGAFRLNEDQMRQVLESMAIYLDQSAHE